MSAPQPNPNSFHFAGQPVIQYDETGKPFFQDAEGRWHMVALPSVASQHHNNMSDGPNEALQPHPGVPTTHVYDPSLVPIDPIGDVHDVDLSDGPTIARAKGFAPSAKVAGARHDKGKGRAVDPNRAAKGKGRAVAPSRKRKHSEDEEEDEGTKRASRPKGVGNYSSDDVSALLDAMEAELPLGLRGYTAVHRRYLLWARRHDRPERALKSLETKFKQLVKTKKPTGDAYCPPEVKRAHQIDQAITERSHTRDISDAELDSSSAAPSDEDEVDNDSDGDSNNDNDNGKPSKPTKKTDKIIRDAIIRRPDPQTMARRPRNSAPELMTRLSDAFDPSAQGACKAERAGRSMQNSQFLALSQQLRDTNATAENLRGQIVILQNRVHDVERTRDKAELKLEMLQFSQSRSEAPRRRHHLHRSSSREDSDKENFPSGSSGSRVRFNNSATCRRHAHENNSDWSIQPPLASTSRDYSSPFQASEPHNTSFGIVDDKDDSKSQDAAVDDDDIY